MKPNEETELAWCAGFFEGEGCVKHDFRKGSRYKDKPPTGALNISMSQTHSCDVLNRFIEALGITKQHLRGPYPNKLGNSQLWRLHVSGKKASAAMEQMRPYFTTNSAKLTKYDYIWYTCGAKDSAYNTKDKL